MPQMKPTLWLMLMLIMTTLTYLMMIYIHPTKFPTFKKMKSIKLFKESKIKWYTKN